MSMALLEAAGRDVTSVMVNAGYRALNSLRMEKGNVAWAADMSPDYTPYHARMERFVSKRKNRLHRQLKRLARGRRGGTGPTAVHL